MRVQNNFIQEIKRGCQEFHKRERRDAMYKVAKFLISYFWDKSEVDIANGLGVLLLTWNQAFYRYGSFDFDKLERFIKDNKNILNKFRNREIESLDGKDESSTKDIFRQLLNSLKANDRKSPVAVAKCLHLLAPGFFPIWDNAIAKGYGCKWNNSEDSVNKYFKFMQKAKDFIDDMDHYSKKAILKNCPDRNSLLKILDEYNYAKYTRKWI